MDFIDSSSASTFPIAFSLSLPVSASSITSSASPRKSSETGLGFPGEILTIIMFHALFTLISLDVTDFITKPSCAFPETTVLYFNQLSYI